MEVILVVCRCLFTHENTLQTSSSLSLFLSPFLSLSMKTGWKDPNPNPTTYIINYSQLIRGPLTKMMYLHKLPKVKSQKKEEVEFLT